MPTTFHLDDDNDCPSCRFRLLMPSPDNDAYIIFDHGVRSAVELDAEVVLLALEYGWFDDDAREYNAHTRMAHAAIRGADSWRGHPQEDYFQWLHDAADDAASYLSDLVPDGYWVGNDGEAGAFGIWPTNEEE